MLKVGSIVILKHTGEKGEVIEILDHEMVNVLLQDDGIEIPVFKEDILLEEEYIFLSHEPPVKEDKPEPPRKVATTVTTNPDKNPGIHLAFDPEYDHEGMVQKFKLFLLNNTIYEQVFDMTIRDSMGVLKTTHGKLDALSAHPLDEEILFDQLNDALVIITDCSLITTAGPTHKKTNTTKIKPKNFFKKIAVAPILNRPVHLYFLLDNTKESPASSKKEDLRTYTKQQVRARPVRKSNSKVYDIHNVNEFANFSIELDLHLENLTTLNTSKWSNARKMNLQLNEFDNYINQAIRLEVDRVFIIHGVGNGRLKNAIASRLISLSAVKTFKNEFHPKYGWGATEVIF